MTYCWRIYENLVAEIGYWLFRAFGDLFSRRPWQFHWSFGHEITLRVLAVILGIPTFL
jgi:hypothetical protein